MPKIKIEGKHKLTGQITISGAKNSAVALIPAAILCDEIVSISNIPNIADVESLEEILSYLGAQVKTTNGTITINPKEINNKEIPESISTKLRASYYFMSALLGKYKKVEMYFPGGCNIGARPIDQTIKGYRLLGAKVVEKSNKYTITASKLTGAKIYLDMPSVGATINIMIVAAKAEGTTIIENAAKEPEIVNVATFLNNMGAKIKGAGTNVIKIEGVKYLHKCFHEVIPDRIEAGTYLIIAALLGENLTINNIIPSHLESLILKLKEAGVNMEIGFDYIKIKEKSSYHAISIKTMGYPGFPTDLQQPLIAFLTQCEGISTVEETIYENRFQNIPDTNKMGADIKVIDNKIAFIKGITPLTGTSVTATDLRGGASLIILGLIADGTTIIDNIKHILRGYDNIIQKLSSVGAKIEII